MEKTPDRREKETTMQTPAIHEEPDMTLAEQDYADQAWFDANNNNPRANMKTQCSLCRHANRRLDGMLDRTCDAFAAGISREIFSSTIDHRQPFPGDNGIRFEPLPGKRHPLDAIQEQR